MRSTRRVATICSRCHGPRILNVVPRSGATRCSRLGGALRTRCSRAEPPRYSRSAERGPLALVPPEAAATLCHVDLDVVSSPLKFVAEPPDMVGR